MAGNNPDRSNTENFGPARDASLPIRTRDFTGSSLCHITITINLTVCFQFTIKTVVGGVCTLLAGEEEAQVYTEFLEMYIAQTGPLTMQKPPFVKTVYRPILDLIYHYEGKVVCPI